MRHREPRRISHDKLKEALSDAQRQRVATGHFNVSDLVALKTVTGAVRTLKVPDRHFRGRTRLFGWPNDRPY